MKQSNLFTKTRKEAPKDEESTNAKLLIRAGYINKEMAGVYSYLPLGLRVLEKISDIIREEMDAIGGSEIHMTTLQEKEIWEKTNRWDDEVVDNWFKTNLKSGGELGLAFTHEEPLTHIMKNYIQSYRDLPVFPYQIQVKFRNELRAKSGIMRGREFLMKDMYSFTKSAEETDAFHLEAQKAYMNIFDRVGIGERTFLTVSNGASFSKYSHEFQTISDAGEDVIHLSRERNIAVNADDYGPEILKDFDLEGIEFEEVKSVEVGDIYKLGTKYSDALGLSYTDEDGTTHPVDMGSYGIGIGRLMGTVVEVLSDEKGIVWPESIAPFQVHLLSLGEDEAAEKVYATLTQKGIEVLFDDRDISAGAKFADSELIGIPYRVVVSANTEKEEKIEVKKRTEEDERLISVEELISQL
ncbi:MAG: aminoacyl--tRNA ligase-related protein [Candidatus Paceibacterota bacterium]